MEDIGVKELSEMLDGVEVIDSVSGNVDEHNNVDLPTSVLNEQLYKEWLMKQIKKQKKRSKATKSKRVPKIVKRHKKLKEKQRRINRKKK
jgi:hypothetical protein